MFRFPFWRGRRPLRQIDTSFRAFQPRPFASVDTPGYAARFEGGSYVLEIRRPSFFAWEALAGEERFSDLVLQATIEADPDNGDSAAGVLFRHASEENYYCLLASTRGEWRLDRVFNNHPLPLVGWSPLPEAAGPARLLRVVANGTRITVAIDEEWVGEVEDDGLVAGGVCFAAQNYDERPRAAFRLHRIMVDSRPVEVERQHLRWSYYFPVQPTARFALAERLCARGAFGAAAVQLSKALKGREGSARERLLLAECLLQVGDTDGALAETERVLVLEPGSSEARVQKANALYLGNRFLEARDWLVPLLADHGVAAGAGVWNLLGNAEYSLGNWRRAADAYLRAAELEPGAPLIQRNAARALELAGDAAGALQRYLEASRLLWHDEAWDELTLVASRVRALDPQNRKVRELEAKVLFHEGRREEAAAALRALIDEGSTDSAIHFLAGVLAGEGGDREQALRLFERAAELEPGFALYQVRVAETLHLLGRDPSVALARARELAPDDPWVANLTGLLALEAGDPAAAASSFEKAAAGSPANPDILINLSEALASSGRLEEALGVLRVRPDEATASAEPVAPAVAARLANQRGNLLARAGRHAEAVKAYEDSISRDPGEPAYQENCAAACIEADLYSRAEQLLSRLAEEHPSASVYNLIGNVAALRGEHHRAELAWSTGLSLEPGNPDIRTNLAAQHLERGSWQRARELVTEVLGGHPDHRHAQRLAQRIRQEHERSLSCSGCGRTWWVPRDLAPQPGLTIRGEPPGEAPAGRCAACGRLYCVACASQHVVESRLTCAACGGHLRLSDDALRWLLSSVLPDA